LEYSKAIMKNTRKRDNTRALIFNVYGDPYRRLAACIILQAIKDAKAGNQEALTWLDGPGLDLLDLLGLELRNPAGMIRDNPPHKIRRKRV